MDPVANAYSLHRAHARVVRAARGIHDGRSLGGRPLVTGDLVLDLRRSVPLQRIECRSHGLELLGRMTDPIDELANNAERLAATEGLRWIPREPLVGQVRVVLELPGRLDDEMRPRPSPLASSAPQTAASRVALK